MFTRIVTFRRLEVVSCLHSCVYLALLICAFALHNPEPATFILGLTHGLMWIVMSLLCIAATRWRVIPFWLAVTVAVLGGLGPFMGTIGFIYETRRRAQGTTADQSLTYEDRRFDGR
ncbi:MAG TPA: hypothetical protein VHV75_03030 [Solirubrobacteraceae bacterium]|jgi:hypothetical protein|nr:hypothetical protein [Solirubrobacteraceae bacterium]